MQASMLSYTTSSPTNNFHQGFSPSYDLMVLQNMCGSCGNTCDSAKSCHSCTVCSVCMPEGQECCVLCNHFVSDPIPQACCSCCGIGYLCMENCGSCSGTVCRNCQMEEEGCCLLCVKTMSSFEEWCTNCGSVSASTLTCQSCAGKVCNICMVAEEACCLLCLETFPASPCSRTSVSPCSKLNFVEYPTNEFCRPPAMDADEAVTAMCQKQSRCQTQSRSDSKMTKLRDSNRLLWADQDDATCSEDVLKVGQCGSDSSISGSTCCEEDSSDSISSAEATTMMIRNIPCRVHHKDVLEAMDALGFVDTYDFVYLPSGRHGGAGKGNLGYAFVNFKTSHHAEHFAATFESFQFPGTSSTKKCTVKYADRQGFNALTAAAKRQPGRAICA